MLLFIQFATVQKINKISLFNFKLLLEYHPLQSFHYHKNQIYSPLNFHNTKSTTFAVKLLNLISIKQGFLPFHNKVKRQLMRYWVIQISATVPPMTDGETIKLTANGGQTGRDQGDQPQPVDRQTDRQTDSSCLCGLVFYCFLTVTHSDFDTTSEKTVQ